MSDNSPFFLVSPQNNGVYGASSERRGGFRNFRKEASFKWPRSWWFYICGCIGCMIMLLLIGWSVVLLVLHILHTLSDHHDHDDITPSPTPSISSSPIIMIARVPFSQLNNGENTEKNDSDNNILVNEDQYNSLLRKIMDLENKLNSISLIPGPPGHGEKGQKGDKGDKGDKGNPGICDASDCIINGDNNIDFNNVGAMSINGDFNSLYAPSLSNNKVALKIKNGDLELIKGGIVSKGTIVSLTGINGNPSDKRIKENIIIRNSTESLNNILNINPVSYSYNDEWMKYSKKEHSYEIGFIAQDVAKIYPNSINKIENEEFGIPDFNLLDDRSIVADLVGSIHKLNNMIKKQSKEIKNLKNK
jgi:hypothetical protein